MKSRREEHGFFLFATAFWVMVAALIALLSLLIPSYKGRGCLTRVFFGLGSVPGIFAAAVSFGFFIPEVTSSLQGWALLTVMILGGALGAYLGARLAACLESAACSTENPLPRENQQD